MPYFNRVTLIGHLGQDPEIKSMGSGDRVCNFSLATSEKWKDKATGEQKERTQWHKISVFDQGTIKVIEAYVKKGDAVMIEGQLETRSYDKDGEKRYATEVVLRPYNSKLLLLSNKRDGAAKPASTPEPDVDEDEILF